MWSTRGNAIGAAQRAYHWTVMERINTSGRYAYAVVVLLACAFALRLWMILDPDLHPWDERFHAVVGLHLGATPLTPTLHPDPALPFDYRDWSNNHIWLHKPPLALWSIAASTRAFGPQPWAVRVPSLVYGFFTVLLCGILVQRWFGMRAAFWAVLVASTNATALELGAGRLSTDHVDVAFCFWVALSVWLGSLWAGRPTWSLALGLGLSLGLAILTKWATALLVVPLVGLLFLQGPHRLKWRAWGQATLALFLALGMAHAWSLYTSAVFPLEAAWESEYNRTHLWQAVEGHDHGPWWHLRWSRNMFGRLGILALAMGLFWALGALRFARKRLPDAAFGYWALDAFKGGKLLVLCLWVLIPLLVFSVAATKMAHYLFVAAPAFWALTGVLLAKLTEAVVRVFQERQGRPWASVAALVLMMGFLLLAFWKPVDRLGRAIDPNASRRKAAAWHDEMRLLEQHAEGLRHQYEAPRTVFYNVSDQTVALFHTQAEAYGWVPDAERWAKRDPKRRHVVVWGMGRPVPAWVDTGACCPDVELLQVP